MKDNSAELIAGCLKIIFSFVFTIIILILLININKRTKTLEQRTRYLIESRDSLIIKEIGNKKYYYKETFIEGKGPGLKLTNTYEGKGVIIKSK